MPEPENALDRDARSLATRLANHVDANLDALAHFVEHHPELAAEGRATLLRALQANANKLVSLARRLG